MKKIFAALAAFTFVLAFTACDKGENTITEERPEEETSVNAETLFTESVKETIYETEPVSEAITTPADTAPAVSMTFIFEPNAENRVGPGEANNEESELNMLENAGSPDYNAEAAIPYVAWTEINLDKYMYAVSPCIGYSAALEDAGKAMIFDPGYEFRIIARTSTGYYRTDEDLYILCENLDNYPPDGFDPENAGSYAPAEKPDVTEKKAETENDGGGS